MFTISIFSIFSFKNIAAFFGNASGRNVKCDHGMLREEELIEQLVGLMDKIDINEIGIKNKFEDEVSRFYKFSKGILGVTGNDFEKQKDLDIRNYAKYVLKEGSILEKREVLACLESKLVMREKKIKLI